MKDEQRHHGNRQCGSACAAQQPEAALAQCWLV